MKDSPEARLFYIVHNMNLPCSCIIFLYSTRKFTVVWYVLMCKLEERCRYFGGTSYVYLQGRGVPEGRRSMFLEQWYLSMGLCSVTS
jgi:hypothetical protein